MRKELSVSISPNMFRFLREREPPMQPPRENAHPPLWRDTIQHVGVVLRGSWISFFGVRRRRP